MTESAPQGPTPAVVLDTNAVLDWLVFGDPGMNALAQALRGRWVRWLATEAMRDELLHVIERPALAARVADRAGVYAVWDALAETRPAPPAHAIRCRDRSDQVFIDLALAAGARWLVTRDLALLQLDKHASIAGTHIIKPSAWP